MQYRVKTSKQTMDILKQMQNNTNLTPNVIARLAISLSLLQKDDIDEFDSDSNGLEFNRNTLTGNQDDIYKILIAQKLNRQITDEEYFPTYIKKHMDRGAALLLNEYNYAGNFEKWLVNLAEFEMESIR